MRDVSEAGEVRFHVVVEVNVSAFVADLINVVWCAEDGDALSIVLHVVAFIFDLVRANKKFEVVSFQEFRSNIGTKRAARASLAWRETWHGAWIAPEHIGHQSAIGRFLVSIDRLQVNKRCAWR